GFTGLDLAFNLIGNAGAVALHHVLTTVSTSMVFLELRGNKGQNRSLQKNENNNDNGVNSNKRKGDDIDNSENGDDPVGCDPATYSSSPTLQLLLEEIEDVCAERRRRLRVEQRLDVRRRASTAVSALPAASPSSSATVARGTTAMPLRTRSTSSERNYPNTDSLRDKTPGASGEPARSKSLRLLPGSEHSAAKPRPLEGALPLRGYYLSPLLDSSFNLLMLREPACDPVDLSLYVNRARHLLDQRRGLREEHQRDCDGGNRGHCGGGSTRNGGGKGGGGSDPLSAPSGTTPAEHAAKSQEMAAARKRSPAGPFKKGTIVSPLAIDLERERVLAERRTLFYVDRDFAARKNARIAGGSRSKVPRSKVLTQKHGNTAFTRELLRGNQQQRSGSGGRLMCPKGLRAHYLGLQNFEYDWGGGARGSREVTSL
ncbi:unnamed protein product, partial [Scytosiphon promiscuus]